MHSYYTDIRISKCIDAYRLTHSDTLPHTLTTGALDNGSSSMNFVCTYLTRDRGGNQVCSGRCHHRLLFTRT